MAIGLSGVQSVQLWVCAERVIITGETGRDEVLSLQKLQFPKMKEKKSTKLLYLVVKKIFNSTLTYSGIL